MRSQECMSHITKILCFFDNIFVAVWDPKQAIREGAVAALRACLILTTQREPKEMQKPQWYRVRRWFHSSLQQSTSA